MFEPPGKKLTDADVVGRPAAKLLAVGEKNDGMFLALTHAPRQNSLRGHEVRR